MQLLNIVNRTSQNQSNVLSQLSTGLKINKASDNPSGLVAMLNFDAELTAVDAAMANGQRADSMLATADGALNEISSMLTDIQSLVIASASDSTLSAAEIAANQAQIDDALGAIDRIVQSTSFNGKKLLNGSQAIQVTGVDADTADDLRIYSRGSSSSDLDITATVKTAAAKAKATITLSGGVSLKEATEIVVSGVKGSANVSLDNTDNRTDIAAAINLVTDLTGVTATVAGNNVDLESEEFGSEEFVQMDVLSGGTMSLAPHMTDLARAEGADAVVTVNGRDVTADGNEVHYSNAGYSLSFTLGTALDAASDTETFTIKADGGMTFQLGGDATSQATVGVDSIGTYNLGGGGANAYLSDLRSGGSADLASQSSNTLSAVNKAITQVASVRGRIGGFQKFQVQSSLNALTIQKESLSAARSSIADTDYAAATAELNRQSILLNSGISLLGVANQQAAQILSLLG